MQLATECQPPVVETARLRYFERMARLYEARPPAPMAPRSPPNSAGRPVSLPANSDKASIKGQSRTHSPNVHLVLDLHVRFSLPPYSSSRSYSFCASRWLTCSSGAWRSGLCSTPLVLRDFLYPTRPGTVSLIAHASPSRVWHALYSPLYAWPSTPWALPSDDLLGGCDIRDQVRFLVAISSSSQADLEYALAVDLLHVQSSLPSFGSRYRCASSASSR